MIGKGKVHEREGKGGNTGKGGKVNENEGKGKERLK